tara:strand:+ start:2293 stop:2616 length:324 start_codon:yes stop_codon:yes gene_type:complete
MYTKRERTNDLVDRIQGVLRDAEDHQQVVDTLAYVMISFGCHINGIEGNLDDNTLSQISARYYTPGRANLADAVILQGCQMLGWGSIKNDTEEDDRPTQPTGKTIEE